MPVINFVPGLNFRLSDAAMFRAENGACPKCGDYFLIGKHEHFYTDAGAGMTWLVDNTCGLCPKCFRDMRRKATETKYYTRDRKAFEVSTLHDDGTFHVKETFERAE